MIVWTIQPLLIYEELKEKGIVYSKMRYSNCNTGIYEIDKVFRDKYAWLMERMKEKIGIPDESIELPFWAYYKENRKNKKPDMRFHNRNGLKPYVLMELSIPDKDVVLIDSNEWTCILNDSPLYFCHNEYEYEIIDEFYDSLSDKDKEEFKLKSWEQVFDMNIYPDTDKDWMSQHDDVEAVFWLLKKEYLKRSWKYEEKW